MVVVCYHVAGSAVAEGRRGWVKKKREREQAKGTGDGAVAASGGSRDLALVRCRAPVNLNRSSRWKPCLSIDGKLRWRQCSNFDSCNFPLMTASSTKKTLSDLK